MRLPKVPFQDQFFAYSLRETVHPAAGQRGADGVRLEMVFVASPRRCLQCNFRHGQTPAASHRKVEKPPTDLAQCVEHAAVSTV